MQAAPLKFSPEERAAHGFTDGLIRISNSPTSIGPEEQEVHHD